MTATIKTFKWDSPFNPEERGPKNIDKVVDSCWFCRSDHNIIILVPTNWRTCAIMWLWVCCPCLTGVYNILYPLMHCPYHPYKDSTMFFSVLIITIFWKVFLAPHKNLTSQSVAPNGPRFSHQLQGAPLLLRTVGPRVWYLGTELGVETGWNMLTPYKHL